MDDYPDDIKYIELNHKINSVTIALEKVVVVFKMSFFNTVSTTNEIPLIFIVLV